VVLEKKNQNGTAGNRKYGIGILMGLGGAIGQALALLTAKKGMNGNFPALSATLIRMLAATIIFWLFVFARGRSLSMSETWKNQKARWAIAGGTLFGPFLGIWLSLIAIKHAHIGIASTLMSLPPIFLIPIAHRLFHDRVTWRSVIGTVVALGGVAMIFLR
jgi:drug/metabolite transporter (DMT)-like permease